MNSDEDPSYENVAALGLELIGWTLVANEEAGPEKSLWPAAGADLAQSGTPRGKLFLFRYSDVKLTGG